MQQASTTTPRRHFLIPACTLCAVTVSGAAQAQSSVTVYGRLDAGVQYSTKTARSDGRLVEQSNGGIRPSVLAFKGTEDLGDGLGAFFNLENHLFADTGTTTGTFWRRQANVGLKSNWGTITLGRQYSPALLEMAGTEPRAYKEQFSGLLPFAFNQAPANNPINDFGLLLGNAVSYSGKFGPVSATGAVAFGEGTGRTYSAGASYTGPVVVSAAFQKINQRLGGDGDAPGTTFYGLGAALPLGAFSIKAQWQHITAKAGDVRLAKIDSFGVGADFAWNPVNTANLSFYYARDKDHDTDKTKTLVLSNDYALSKRTTLYVQLAIADGDRGATTRTTVIANGVFPGSTTSVFGAGVSHNF